MKHLKFTVAQLLMLKRIIEYANDNAAVTNSIPALQNAISDLTTKVAVADQLFTDYSATNTGLAAAKKQARLDLVVISFAVMKTAYAYAANVSDPNLAAQTNTNLSSLQRMGFAALIYKMEATLAAVQPIVANLLPYDPNIIAKMTSWQNSINLLNNLLNSPQQAILAHKQLGAQIKSFMKQTVTFTRTTIDSIVASMNMDYPLYHNGYFTQRQIINPAQRHSCFKGQIVNELNQPLGPGIKVTINQYEDVETGKTFQAVSGFTDINGEVIIKEFFPAPRTIRVSGNNIVPKKFGPFNFERGKTLVQSLTCQPTLLLLPSIPVTPL